jgi:hypothetical protein
MWLEVRIDCDQQNNGFNQQRFLFHTNCDTSMEQIQTKISFVIYYRCLLMKAIEFINDDILKDSQLNNNDSVTDLIRKTSEIYHLFCESEQYMVQRESLNMKLFSDKLTELKESISKLSTVYADFSAKCLKLFDDMQRNEKTFSKQTEMYLFDKKVDILPIQKDLNTENTNFPNTRNKRVRRKPRKPSLGTLSYYVGTNEKTKVNLVVRNESIHTYINHNISHHELIARFNQMVSSSLNALANSGPSVPVENGNVSIELEHAGTKRPREEESSINEAQKNYERSFFDSDKFNTLKKRKLEAKKNKKIGRRSLRIAKEFVLPQQKLDFIGRSNYLKSKLRDPTIQQMILDVDTAYNRESYLKTLMDNVPEFTSFCNELLYLVDGKEETFFSQEQQGLSSNNS